MALPTVHEHLMARDSRSVSLRDALRTWLLDETAGDPVPHGSPRNRARLPAELRERLASSGSALVEAAILELEELGELAHASVDLVAEDLVDLAEARVNARPALVAALLQKAGELGEVATKVLEALAAASGGSRIAAASMMRSCASAMRKAWPPEHRREECEELARRWETAADAFAARAAAAIIGWEGAA